MLGNFLKIDYIVESFLKPLNSACFNGDNDSLSGKQVGSQAICRVTRRLAWIQPVCISINVVPAATGSLTSFTVFKGIQCNFIHMFPLSAFVQDIVLARVSLVISCSGYLSHSVTVLLSY